ncbi:MAG: hypothetical protein Q4C22_05310 [Bacillota bacterium]|nr:hypothetical protein [Bacillota bacterium]
MDRNSSVRSRFEILKTVYRQAGGAAGKRVLFFPRQIEDAFFNDVSYDLKIMREKGLVEYSGNFITYRFRISLTEKGAALVARAYEGMKLPEEERASVLEEVFQELRI